MPTPPLGKPRHTAPETHGKPRHTAPETHGKPRHTAPEPSNKPQARTTSKRAADTSRPVAPVTADRTPQPVSGRVDITAAPRVVITLASGLVTRVFGELMPSARDNAWQAVCADRARAAQREELAAVLRDALSHGPVDTGIVRDTVGTGAGPRRHA